MDPLAARHARDRHLTERLSQQAAFVRALAARHAQAAAGAELADRAEAVMRRAGASGDLAAGLAEAEAVLLPLAPLAKSYTIHCLGHAHIDMNWMWPWEETVATAADTFRTALRLMDEFPGLTLVQSQAALYAAMDRYHPRLLDAIGAQVRAGTWEVAAAHWVEGDRNLASGESLARQLLVARAFCRERLGLDPEAVPVDWVPDCFGHAATLPMLDRAAAVRHYYCWRTGRTDRPPVFRWRSPDGSEVLVSRELASYNAAPSPDSWRHALAIEQACGVRGWLLVYGVGDHGGGPTRRQIRRILDQDAWPVFPRWRFATARSWFALLEGARERLPLVADELNTEYTGCMTSQAAVKRNNRRGEVACAEADAAGALGLAVAGAAPRRDLTVGAWQDVCFGQFHDILPGSGVRATREYSGGQQQRILAAAGAAATEALRAVAGRIDLSWVGAAATGAPPPLEPPCLGGGSGWGAGALYAGNPCDGWPAGAVWFNPLALRRDEVATLRVWEGEGWQADGPERRFRLRLADGRLLPAQRLGQGAYWGHRYVDLAVPVAVGAAGWASAAVEEGDAPAPPRPAVAVREEEGGRNHPPLVNLPSGRLALENGLLAVEFDRLTGTVRSLRPADGREFAAGPGFAGLLAAVERPGPMSAWITGDDMRAEVPVCEGLDVVHAGPLLAAVQARLRWRDSTMTVTYALAAGSPRLAVTVEARWLERGGPQAGVPRLSIRFPSALVGAAPRYEIPFGTIARDLQPGRIVPSQRFAALAGTLDGGAAALTVANDGAYGHAAAGGCLTVHLVRSSYDPDPLPDCGDHRWAFAVRPWDGHPDIGLQIDEGRLLNHPLRPTLCAAHGGDLPADSGEVLACAPAAVQVAQLKPAEDGDGLIVRLQETAGVAAAPLLRWRGAAIAGEPVDLLERPLPGPAAIAAHGIASLRIRPGG